jgi:hypothetical protein
MSWIPGLASGIFSFLGADQSYNQDSAAYQSATQAAGQDAAAQSKLFGSVENTLGGAWGNFGPYQLAEAQTGMNPMVRAAALNSYNVQNQQQMANVKNQFGSVLPNLSGTLEDMHMQNLQGGIQLQGSLASQDQGIRDNAMQSYFGGAMSMANPLLNIADQYGSAGQTAQQNAMYAMNGMQQNNPWSALGNSLSGMNFGGMFGGGGGGSPGGLPSQYGSPMPTYSPFGGGGGMSGQPYQQVPQGNWGGSFG